MEYQPPAPPHTNIFENYIDTQRYAGHTSEGGPLPAYLLTQQFEETPGTFDPYAYYDYSRRTLADFRADPPLFENESPRDTRKWSKMRMNVRTTGTRSGADPAAHPEMFMGFMDEDTRTPGDDHFPAWKMAAQMAARAHYLKPAEPEGASHLGEGEPGDIEPETERYKKLLKARAYAKRNVRMFGRSIENDQARAGRDWMPLPCVVGDQKAEGGAGSSEQAETTMRRQKRAEYTPGDEKHCARPRSSRQTSMALRAAMACARASGGGASELIGRESHGGAPIRIDASARADAHARLIRHRGSGPAEVVVEKNPTQGQRGQPSLRHLAMNMADCARQAESEMAGDDTPGPGAVAPRSWHLDPGDPLALLHRATGHEAERSQEILEIATQIASRTTRGPWSMPHLAVHRDGSLGRALEWGGGPESAMIDDAVPSYLAVDALLMQRACAIPQETALIRRKMVTDARKPTTSELTFANRTAALLAQYKGAVVASSRTYRDMEMGADAMQVHNAHLASIGSAPASWHHAQRALTETQLTAEPQHCTRTATSTPREAPVAANMMRAAMFATRVDQSQQTEGRAGDFTSAGIRRGDMSDWVGPPDERERQLGHVAPRVGRPEPMFQRRRRDAVYEDGMTPALDLA